VGIFDAYDGSDPVALKLLGGVMWRLARFVCRDRKFRGLGVWVRDAPPVKTETRSIIPLRKMVREKEVYETYIRINKIHREQYGYFLARKEELELLDVYRDEVIKTSFRNWRRITRKEWDAIIKYERGKNGLHVQVLRDETGDTELRDLLGLCLSEYQGLQKQTVAEREEGG